jgi:heme-degrading monooxygenase HmoA
MFARTTTVTARQEGIDRGIRYIQDEVMPALPEIEGFVGVSTLVDRATGRCIITSSWQSAQAMRDSEPRIQLFRERVVAAFDAFDATVDSWEVALMRRAHTAETAAGAHVSWLEGDPDTMGELVDAFRAALPSLEQLPGFASASLLLDRTGGRAVSTVVFDSPTAMARARAGTSGIRTSVADATGAYVIEVAEFELPVSQLRVPELV